MLAQAHQTDFDSGPRSLGAGAERLCVVSRQVKPVGEMIRQKVRDKHGIELRWEVRRMGHFLPGREVKEFMDGAPFTGAV